MEPTCTSRPSPNGLEFEAILSGCNLAAKAPGERPRVRQAQANRIMKRDANPHAAFAGPRETYGCGLAFGSGGVVGFLSFC